MNPRKPYSSDLSDLQWDNISHLFPPDKRRTGRPRSYPAREVVNAALYIARTGCAWRPLPHDFPPWGLVSDYFYTLRDRGLWAEVHAALRGDARAGPAASRRPPPASSTVRPSRRPRPADPGGTTREKKIGGRKRHILVDTLGLIWGLAVLPADVQDRDGARVLLERVRGGCRAWRRSGPTGRTPPSLTGFGSRSAGCSRPYSARWGPRATSTCPSAWIVERTFGWFGRYRRLSKDY